MRLLWQPFLDSKLERKLLRRQPMRPLLVHWKIAGEPILLSSRHARTFPLILRGKRTQKNQTVPSSCKVARRRLLGRSVDLRFSTLRHRRTDPSPRQSTRNKPTKHPVHRHRQRRPYSRTARSDVRDGWSSRIQLSRQGNLLDGSDNQVSPSASD